MAFIVILLVLVGSIGGVLSFKAHTTLPGDSLYPYKLAVNENIADFVAHTDESQVRFDMYVLQERLLEARKLAMHSRLNVQEQNMLINTITKQVTRLTNTIAALQSRGAFTEASSVAELLHKTLSIETRLTADVNTLGSSNLQVSLASILTRLRTSSATVAMISTKAHAKVADAKSSADLRPTIIPSR